MYHLLSSPEYACRWMEKTPQVPGLYWRDGTVFTSAVPAPLGGFVLQPRDPDSSCDGADLPPYFLRNVPLIRDDLLAAMRECGVTNLDAYPAEILDPDSGKTITSYYAVNVIGLIAAADMQRSSATVHTQPALLDVDFDGLVVDRARARSQLIFRLAESSNAILCHERLVDHLANRGFEDTVTFLDPEVCAL